jgi:hypothetical protein
MTNQEICERVYQVMSNASLALPLLADGVRCHVEPGALDDDAAELLDAALEDIGRLADRLGRVAFQIRFPDGGAPAE